MTMHKALKPFGWYPDGFTREALNVGDERDFGSAADGLVAEKMIAPVDASPVDDAQAKQTIKPVEETAVEQVAEQTVEPVESAPTDAAQPPRQTRRKK